MLPVLQGFYNTGRSCFLSHMTYTVQAILASGCFVYNRWVHCRHEWTAQVKKMSLPPPHHHLYLSPFRPLIVLVFLTSFYGPSPSLLALFSVPSALLQFLPAPPPPPPPPPQLDLRMTACNPVMIQTGHVHNMKLYSCPPSTKQKQSTLYQTLQNSNLITVPIHGTA